MNILNTHTHTEKDSGGKTKQRQTLASKLPELLCQYIVIHQHGPDHQVVKRHLLRVDWRIRSTLLQVLEYPIKNARRDNRQFTHEQQAQNQSVDLSRKRGGK